MKNNWFIEVGRINAFSLKWVRSCDCTNYCKDIHPSPIPLLSYYVIGMPFLLLFYIIRDIPVSVTKLNNQN